MRDRQKRVGGKREGKRGKEEKEKELERHE